MFDKKIENLLNEIAIAKANEMKNDVELLEELEEDGVENKEEWIRQESLLASYEDIKDHLKIVMRTNGIV